MTHQLYNSFAARKRAWRDGPWQEEPDKRVWTDPATGLVCMHRRCADGGYLCGYVGIEAGHPLFGFEHDAIPAALGITAHRGLDESGLCEHGEEAEAMCHIPAAGKPDTVWWLGFKCDQGGDHLPSLRPGEREVRGDSYRDVDYVTAECAKLASRLAALGKPAALPAPSGKARRDQRARDRW